MGEMTLPLFLTTKGNSAHLNGGEVSHVFELFSKGKALPLYSDISSNNHIVTNDYYAHLNIELCPVRLVQLSFLWCKGK